MAETRESESAGVFAGRGAGALAGGRGAGAFSVRAGAGADAVEPARWRADHYDQRPTCRRARDGAVPDGCGISRGTAGHAPAAHPAADDASRGEPDRSPVDRGPVDRGAVAMPEGDTIFRTARSIGRALIGKPVTVFRSTYPLLTRFNDDAPIAGQSVDRVEARGKWMLIHFSGGGILASHLLMNGRWH